MASVDGERAFQDSFEESVQLECSPCRFEGIQKEAKFYCRECGDYLCEACESSHKKLSMTRKHKLVSGGNMPKRNSSEQEVYPGYICSCNKTEVALYCHIHNEILCLDCKTLNHRNCQTASISYASGDFQSVTADLTLQTVTDLMNNISLLRDSREKDLHTLTTLTDKGRKSVKDFKSQLIAQIEKMEKNSLVELNRYDGQQRSIIDQHISICNTAVKRLQDDKKPLEAARKAEDRNMMFIHNLQNQKMAENMNSILSDINKEVREPSISFSPEYKLLITDISSLGTVKTGDIAKQHVRIALENMKIKPTKQVDVRLPSDENNPWITGSLFLPTGELIICDKANEKIKILKEDLTHKDNLKLSGAPWGIALANESELISTIPSKNLLQFILLSPKLQATRNVQLDNPCYGVATAKGSIYVSFKTGGIIKLDQNGKNKTNIGLNSTFQNAYYIAISQERLYVSENETKSVMHCLLKDGTPVFQYTDSDMIGNMTIYIDEAESILTCGYSSNNVQIIDKNGKKIKTLLSKADGLSEPFTISFRQRDKCLVIGGRDQRKLIIFTTE